MARIGGKTAMPQNVGKQRKVAQSRQDEYVRETTILRDENDKSIVRDPKRPSFIKWLRGRYGMTVEERHGAKVTR